MGKGQKFLNADDCVTYKKYIFIENTGEKR